MKLLLFAQLHETESLRALSDCVFSEELQQATQLESIFSVSASVKSDPKRCFLSDFLDLVTQIYRKTRFSKATKHNDTTKNH